MEFTDYMIWKALILIGVVFVVNLVYTWVTGQTIEEANRDTREARKRGEGK